MKYSHFESKKSWTVLSTQALNKVRGGNTGDEDPKQTSGGSPIDPPPGG